MFVGFTGCFNILPEEKNKLDDPGFLKGNKLLYLLYEIKGT